MIKSNYFAVFYIVMAFILHIETATEVCSVALSESENIIDVRENTEGRSHAALLTSFIENILRKNRIAAKQLSAVAVSSGPGSYTGLRIGVSAAKGLCYGASIPLIAVPTLQSMALGFITRIKDQPVEKNILYCPMIDARRLEVYTALFDAKAEPMSEISARIIDENSFADVLTSGKIIFFGNGAPKCREIIKHPNALFHDGFVPSATDLASIAAKLFNQKKFEDVAYFEPFYLKDFIATVPKNKVFR